MVAVTAARLSVELKVGYGQISQNILHHLQATFERGSFECLLQLTYR